MSSIPKDPFGPVEASFVGFKGTEKAHAEVEKAAWRALFERGATPEERTERRRGLLRALSEPQEKYLSCDWQKIKSAVEKLPPENKADWDLIGQIILSFATPLFTGETIGGLYINSQFARGIVNNLPE